MDDVASEKLSREQVELVLRRAADMEAARDGAGGGRDRTEDELSVTELVRLGREAGLRSDAIMRALADLRRGALAEQHAGGLDRLWGPAEIVISRVVPGPPESVQRSIDRFLRKQLMTVRRHHGSRVEWERARGLLPGLARSLDFSKRYAFAPVTRIETVVLPETDESTSVTFRIDLSELRRTGLVGLALRATAAFGVVGLGGAALLPGFGANDVLALVAGGAAAGGLSALERRRFEQKRQRIALEPERFLDLLVQRRTRAGAEGPPEGVSDDGE
jgi:hypothetical protein